MVSIPINKWYQSLTNTSFCFRHTLLLSTRFSQSYAPSYSSLMPHHWVNDKCNGVKGSYWRWLIFALCNFYYIIICYVFSEATTTVLESFTIPQESTCVGVSFLKSCRPAGLVHICFSLYLIIHVNYVKSYCLYKSLPK